MPDFDESLDQLDRANLKTLTKDHRISARLHRYRYELARKKMPPQADIFDYGCGWGYGAAILAKSKNFNSYIGYDVNEKILKYAREKYGKFGTYTNSLPARKFDLITSFEVLEHVDDYKQKLNYIYNSLSDRGILILSTPNREICNPGQPFTAKPKNPFHVREWTVAELVSEMKNSKFKILGLYGQAFIAKPVLRKIFRGFGTLIKTLTRRPTSYNLLKHLASPSNTVLVCRKDS